MRLDSGEPARARPVSAISWERCSDGVTLRSPDLLTRVSWVAPGTVRVTAVPAAMGEPVGAYGPMLDPACALRPPAFETRETRGEVVTSDGVLSVHLDPATSAVGYRDARGRSLLTDAKALRPRAVAGEGYSARLELRFPPGQALYGLGQHEEGRLDYRGREQELYQHPRKAPVPFLVSTAGWGVLWHGYSAMSYHGTDSSACLLADSVPEIDYFVIAGANLDAVVAGYRRLTGPAPLPPRWAFGFVQSEQHYQTQEELLDAARRYARLGLPADCVTLDRQGWPQQHWGQKSFDPKRFPDPSALCRQLHELGTHLMVSIWPRLHNDGPDQTQLRDAGKLLADGHTYDALDPQARAMFWRQAEEGLFAHGVDAWWADGCEPFPADWPGVTRPAPAVRRGRHVTAAQRCLGPAMSNAYPLLHTGALWEGQRRSGSGKRVVVVASSAWAGQQRHGTFVRSGDLTASWETLRRQIPEGLNFCASGLPYWTCDIGGFDAGSAASHELFLRWFQYGTFLPMMQVHGNDPPGEIWNFGEPGSVLHDTMVRFRRLRKDLMPYLYSVAAAVCFDGYTMMRALGFDFGHDPAAVGVQDQFMLGPALLVCPVTAPGATSRPVYLPAGTGWVDLWDGTTHEGGKHLDVPVPLGAIPVFARAGSILPLDRGILVFPGADGTFSLYEDAGDGWGYESGDSRSTGLHWNDADGLLTVGPAMGGYPQAPEMRPLRARLVRPGQGWRPDDAGDGFVRQDYRGGLLRLRL